MMKGFIMWFNRKLGFLQPIPYKYKIPDLDFIKKRDNKTEGINNYILVYLDISDIEVDENKIILSRKISFSEIEKAFIEKVFKEKEYKVVYNEIILKK